MNFNTKRAREQPNASNSNKKNKFTVFSNNYTAVAVLVDLIKLASENKGGVVHNVLQPDRVYTVGRGNHDVEFIFNDPCVSKRHCQLLFDGFYKKFYLLNGALSIVNYSTCAYCDDGGSNDFSKCVVNEFRSRLVVNDNVVEQKGKNISCDDHHDKNYNNCVGKFNSGLIGNDKVVEEKRKVISCGSCRYVCKGNMNGVFVNGVSIGEGLVVELSVGDEVLFVCGNRSRACDESKSKVGFVVKRIVFHEELVEPGFDGFRFERPSFVRPLLGGKVNKRVFTLTMSDLKSLRYGCDEIVNRAKSLLACCNYIAGSYDPVSCIRQSISTHSNNGGSSICKSKKKKVLRSELNGDVKSLRKSVPKENVAFLEKKTSQSLVVKNDDCSRPAMVQSTNVEASCVAVVPLETEISNLYPKGSVGDAFGSMFDHKITINGRNKPINESFGQKEGLKKITSPGKKFYLNRLDSMHDCSPEQDNVVSLPELLHPVSSISRMFVATLTSDIGWFLTYCDIPSHLPITIACHNTERCWSADPGKRTCVPDPDFPNLIVVYPPFPEVIAFGKDRKNKGVGCHHPKFFVLQREDSIRVIISSANLVAKQWKSVTNTVWWQDFPRRAFPDCISLFNKLDDGMKNKSTSDFAAQLAGFMASLITDVPSQAYWIFELTKYDFTEANAQLIASVPGIHSYRSISTASIALKFECSKGFLGSVVASVVGLSHRFRNTADSNGLQLKKLAAYLGQSSKNRSGMSEIKLRREKNVPQDVNAISVLVSNHKLFSNGDCVQLGFLPRTVAKWVSPLWDIGFFTFHGYVCPQDALAAASGESNTKVPLILHVSQGPNTQEITKVMKSDHIVAFCSLIASLQRCTGLWRLEEVLTQYTWPESLESDFIYGASSIGTSIGAPFLAAFSAAAGKKSQAYDSQESDPEWGCWNVDHEMKCPSIRIIFPTIERVKTSHCGILPSKHILSFPEKTWQRLKTVDILHDAIPDPIGRVGHPMHVKVARRKFTSNTGASSGWVYCGSHNISAAAWGQPISSQSRGQQNGNSSCLRLHVCNYELGLLFVFPPSRTIDSVPENPSNLDNINLPFVVPAPKYGLGDRAATKRAMSEAFAAVVEQEGRVFADVAPTDDVVEDEVEEEEDEDEVVVGNYAVPEEDDEKAYADVLWHQVDSSQELLE